MLHEIAETTRSPSGIRYAVVTTIDGTGRIEDAVLCGLTPEEERRVVEWTDDMQDFETLRDLPSPLLAADMPAHVGGSAFPPTR